jgi:hypothetical protein
MRLTYAICLLFSSCILTQAARAENPKNNGHVALDQSKDVLFEQLTSNSFSLQLLQVKNKFDHKTLVLGGVGELDLQHWQGDNIVTLPVEQYHDGTSFYFTQATFDMMANYNNWSTAFLSISGNHLGQPGPDGNYFYLPHAFILLGDLNKFPVYLTLGSNTIPFGNFVGSGVWNTPLTSSYFSPQPSPQISLGFYKNKWDLSGTFYSDNINHENHFTTALNYSNALKAFNYGFGVGYINDLKSNTTGNPTTKTRHTKFSAANDLGRVWDVNATVGYKLVSLVGEYLSGSKSVGLNTAKPQAFNLTFTFAPVIYGTTTTFGLSSSVALNLRDIPTSLSGKDNTPLVAAGLKNNSALSVSRSIFSKNIILGFDAERAITYDNKHTLTYTLDLLAYL